MIQQVNMKKTKDQNKSFSRARLDHRRGQKKSWLLMLSGSDTFSKSLGDDEVVVVEANGDNW